MQHRLARLALGVGFGDVGAHLLLPVAQQRLRLGELCGVLRCGVGVVDALPLCFETAAFWLMVEPKRVANFDAGSRAIIYAYIVGT